MKSKSLKGLNADLIHMSPTLPRNAECTVSENLNGFRYSYMLYLVMLYVVGIADYYYPSSLFTYLSRCHLNIFSLHSYDLLGPISTRNQKPF